MFKFILSLGLISILLNADNKGALEAFKKQD